MQGLTGIKAELIEPISMKSQEDWREIVNELDAWGEVPQPESVTRLTTEKSERGIVALIEAEDDWIAEFLPWGSDGLLKVRSKNAPGGSDVPLGGYSWNGRDVIILRRSISKDENSGEALVKALQEDDLESCQRILGDMGKCLGTFHSSMRKLRELPPDQKRWNSRNEKIEGLLRAQFIWRAPYTKEQPCTVSLLDVRMSDFSGNTLRIGPPRLSDALIPHESEKPAMRDLASLVHDLSRIHHRVSTNLQLKELRMTLIGGWRETAPEEWASDNAFYSHRGGMAIWEYEQCLMDVLEASSNQSGAPQPAIDTLQYVKMYQKKMFNNRTFAALSFMAFFFGVSTLINQFPPSLTEMIPPLAFFAAGYFCLKTYRGMSPPPESPFSEV
ncbi:MAG TPA: hypothetical protein HA314_00810 [Candidatus Thalassarchaeaceae archaeon]|nr:hypothetical protein [Candidatus Thalassarchaeaceae archaeon]